jgi:hypothetical protein
MSVGRRRCDRHVKTDSEMGQRFKRYLQACSPEEKKKYKSLKCHQAKALFRVEWMETVWAPYEAQRTFDFRKLAKARPNPKTCSSRWWGR